MNLVRACRTLAIALIAAAAAWVTPSFAQQQATQPVRQIMVMVPHPPTISGPAPTMPAVMATISSRSARERLARKIARQFGTDARRRLADASGRGRLFHIWPSGGSVDQAGGRRSRARFARGLDPARRGLHREGFRRSGTQRPLFQAQPAARQWQLARLQRLSIGNGVRVAVIDSGIDAAHPDLAARSSSTAILLPERR